MNILIPHHWLLKHLRTQAAPEKIQSYLSLSGPSVERIETIETEPVYHIEVTTNRVDMMSVRGIAREAATILPEFGLTASLRPLSTKPITNTTKLDLTIKNDPKICKRILAIKLSIPQVKLSPKWLQKRLLQVGQRPLNNLVDVTNFVMWEIGHPTHVFDYDKFSQKTILVRTAKKGELITTLNDKTYTTVGGEVIFDDGTGTIIDMPGLMGTKNTVVDQNTKNIIFFVDSVNAEKIRFASMTHAIRSQAAILNEKHVDPDLGLTAIERGVQLYQKIAGATVESQLVDIYPRPTNIQPITLRQSQLDTYLGTSIKSNRVSRILSNLGCRVKHRQHTYQVTPPTYRSNDLTIYQDLIEEVARIYGYHNLDSHIMDTPIPNNPPPEDFSLEYNVKTFLAGWGAQEVYTYSAISRQLATSSSFRLNQHLKIKNPLTDDFVYLRKSLIPSHHQVILDNPNSSLLTIFEMANVYHQTKPQQLPHEQLTLTLSSNTSYSHTKGLLDSLAAKLFLHNFRVIPQIDITTFPEFEPKQSGSIYSGKILLGVIGLTKLNIFSFSLWIKPLTQIASTHPTFIPTPQTTPIIEDLTFKLPAKTHLGPIINHISTLHRHITSVTLKSTYRHNYTFNISYQHPTHQLTDKNILPIRKKIVSSLKRKFKASLVGQI